MKKLFSLIGIIIAIFSIFFLFLIADKQIHVNDKNINDFILNDCYISINELNDIATFSDTQIQIRTYNYINFGHNEIDIIILNPDVNLVEGVQPSIFPKNKINYKFSNYNSNKTIQYFMIQENDKSKLNTVMTLLDEKNLSYDVLESQPIKFNMGILFSSLNAKFFMLLLILLILCIISYYAHRLKEIGILRLNGWSDFKISLKIITKSSAQTIISCVIIMSAFSIFITTKDKSLLETYLLMCSILLVFTLGIFFMSCFIATIFISKLNNILAIKNGRNNKVFCCFLIITKLVITFVMLVDFSHISTNILNSINIIESSNHLQKYNFYYIHTSVALNENKIEQINQYLSTLSDDDIYNYGSIGKTYSSLELSRHNVDLNSYSITDDSYGVNIYTTITISNNLLDELNIQSASDQTINNKDKMTVFIPNHLKHETSQILFSSGLTYDLNLCDIEYIKDGQVFPDLLYPDRYLYDPIIISQPVQKSLYLNGGVETLHNERNVDEIAYKLISLGIDESSCNILPFKSQINVSISNEILKFTENLFVFTLNLLSYILSSISVITIYFELNKKAFGVYCLVGQIPYTIIMPLIIFNSILVSIFSIFINVHYLVLVISEIILYLMCTKKYINKNAISSIKGE